jgi:hypothetical protein
MYGYNYAEPMTQILRFTYDTIKFKYDMYNEKPKIEVIGMSDKCKQNLEKINILRNINS